MMANDIEDTITLSTDQVRQLEELRDDDALPVEVREAAAIQLIRRRRRVGNPIGLPSYMRDDEEEDADA